MEPSNYGRTVPESEAHTYVENYKALRATLIEEVLPLTPDDAPQPVKESVTFHKSKVNAFLFDAALIKELFEDPNPAPYFAVFLGANGTEPTVLCAGLYEGDEPNTVKARADKRPDQHPTLLPDAKYPSNDNGPIAVPK
jgi:hypothetical protein